jgi:carbonic anhydrase/acetyltransferase-like protein (isoleucine patch superfamily)
VQDGQNSLERSLSRARDALAKREPAPPPPKAAEFSAGQLAASLGVLALALFALAFATGKHGILLLALAAAAAGGLLVVNRQARDFLGGLLGHGPAGLAGMGATVASSAAVEPGARVEMGASVGAGAVVRSGAVVRMGASVGKGAVIESGAVVSWGASVRANAVVEQGAIVGAGSDVLRGARVPAGTWLRPGSSYGGGLSTALAASRAPAAPEPDPRQARVASACDKLQAELRASPERVREFLGNPESTISALRATCEDLARRERELRAEADPAALSRLMDERAAIEQRLAAQDDPAAAASLRGALAAIDEQKRQRELTRLAAERLDAEHTRLLYTLEGLASHFVRLRSAGGHASEERPRMERAVEQLRAELDAIAGALEEVTAPAASLREVAGAPASPEAARAARVRTRE